MKMLGFKPTKNSGSGWIEKEDGVSDHSICQLKSTDKDSISIKLKDLHMLIHNAVISHKTPIFAIQFLQSDEVWVMIMPEDIENVKDIVTKNNVQKNVSESVFLVDSDTESCYNNDVQIDNRKHNLKARNKMLSEKNKEGVKRKKK